MNLSACDLNLLVVFDALHVERSVTRAAARLRLSQPATSNALARLRLLMRDPLFIRDAGAMIPTARAQRMAGAVEAALAHAKRALDDQTALDPAASERSFTVATTEYGEALLLVALAKRIRRIAPGITMKVSRAPSQVVPPIEELERGAVDLIVGPYYPPFPTRPGIVVQTLYEDHYVVVASSANRQPGRRLALQKYLGLDHVAVVYPGEGPEFIDSLLLSKGLARKIALGVPHYFSAAFLVAATDLIITVPERLAKIFARVLPLRILALPVPIAPVHVSLIWHERDRRDAAHRWLRDQLAKQTRSARRPPSASHGSTPETLTRPAHEARAAGSYPRDLGNEVQDAR